MPNPWIAVPSLAMGVLAGVLGWLVTDTSCQQSAGGPCQGLAVLVGVLAFVSVVVGVAVVLVLVYRSLAEWRERSGS